MTQLGRTSPTPPPSDYVQGIRRAGRWPNLGILRVSQPQPPRVTEEQIDTFLNWLSQLVQEVAEFDSPMDREGVADLKGTAVRWSRLRYKLYPLYIEQLCIVEHIERPKESLPAGLEVCDAQWRVAEQVFREGESHYHRQEAAWRNFLRSACSNEEFSGGFAFNMIEVPKEAFRTESLDVRPLVLHALAPDGTACDRGDVKAQAAIANAFWQTFWATGALRSERGQTFPVAFLPCDRSWKGEFAPPFRERWISLHRRVFGRTSILAYVCEALTSSKALFWDPQKNTFNISDKFQPECWGLEWADVKLTLYELSRTAFVDAYIGENAHLFSQWRELEAQDQQGRPWCESEAKEFMEKSHPQFVRNGAELEQTAERIRRVVPYVGCAFLSEVVNETERLRSRGKIQHFEDEILAATNSTFFLNFPEEYVTLHSAMNDPVAVLIENGRTHQIRTLRRATFVRTMDGESFITTNVGLKLLAEPLIFEGESVAASPFTKADRSYAENKVGPVNFGAVIVGNSIVETFEDCSTEVPMNGWVIGDSEAFGGEIEPSHAADVEVVSPISGTEVAVRHAFAVGPMLVSEGEIVPLGSSKEEFQPVELTTEPRFEENAELPRTGLSSALRTARKRGVPPTRFPYDWDRTRAPRTAIGVRADGTVVLVVVDGRADLRHSCGATLAELAQLMKNLGCREAMNMDGGGSSVMFINDPCAHKAKLRPELRDGVVNLPSDLGGVERLLPVPLVICRPKVEKSLAG
ncbi:MAG: phosphodiester glycosidase family protein [Candidatus Hydrogenedentota bacterium]|uniref:N-acetylmuramoyl-L-alanine amidase/putative S-layer protein n=1 Tax=Sumerlaea chitinivorans TaxID=2250252 RepID=A0A2Z4Y5D3_SUMC1|nr:N-acetylmuramoyl-L-alanine amidase/putative S-layer protein [Candidatus Sumerlaea chitinivorans]RMH25414.1 MAG: phosphodiester glycosidase family protein [Candidatus Hydrogenedentota bacterium]GIX44314.1 MAG: hypothetical protein KatS3mg130_0722 [Candidatus Sumerlaea sp.]